jgi:hypothetical protein
MLAAVELSLSLFLEFQLLPSCLGINVADLNLLCSLRNDLLL